MKYTLSALLGVLMFVSCAPDFNELIGASGSDAKSKVEIRLDVQPFNEVNVGGGSRANMTPLESSRHMSDIIIFGNDGRCVFYQHNNSSDNVFAIDRATSFDDTIDQNNLSACRVYSVANVPHVYERWVSGELDYGDPVAKFLDLVDPVKEILSVPEDGFPMVGGYGKDVDLRKETTTPPSAIPIEMRVLYAKINVEISVKSDQYVPGVSALPYFTLNEWSVHNVVESVDYVGGVQSTESTRGTSDTTRLILDEKGVAKVFKGALPANTVAEHLNSGSKQKIRFSFYLPERYLAPKYLSKEYQYAFVMVDADGNPIKENGQYVIRDEDLKYRQRHKPCLVAENDPAATFVRINGTYSDYQDHEWRVQYDIYVGGDNYANFDVVRNTAYNNVITIRGVKKSAWGDPGTVSVDHRVDIEHQNPFTVGIERELLLDSHYEVRPLRIKNNPDSKKTGGTVTVSIENPDEADWLRLENSGSTDQHITSGVSAGKRKYFTTNLVTETLKDSYSVTVDLPGSGEPSECIWIYVDECAEKTTEKDAARSARIKIVHTDTNGTPCEPVYYTVNQYKLYPVETQRTQEEINAGADPTATYYIEHEEEYLYNFDSEDPYLQTEWNGMEWGLNGIQLSHNVDAADLVYQSTGFWDSLVGLWMDRTTLMNEAFKNLNIKYDFYLYRDIKGATLEATAGSDEKKNYDFSGYYFNTEIADYIKTEYPEHQNPDKNKDLVAKVEYIALDENPLSAFAYCYNKNKRNKYGEVEKIEWYLPAVDEIEDIAEFAYSDFDGVFQGSKYWSCQPSYLQHDLDLDLWKYAPFSGGWGDTGQQLPGYYYTDDTSHARATRALKELNDEGKYEFSGVISSGSPTYGTQGGQMRLNEWTSKVTTQDIDKDHYTRNPSFTYDGHEGNMPRTGVKARVRCVRKVD